MEKTFAYCQRDSFLSKIFILSVRALTSVEVLLKSQDKLISAVLIGLGRYSADLTSTMNKGACVWRSHTDPHNNPSHGGNEPLFFESIRC